MSNPKADPGQLLPANPKNKSALMSVLQALASLKITVVLFCLSMFLVLVGTLAQATEGIWTVIDSYFRSFYVFIPFKAFLPPAWFPNFDVHAFLDRNNIPLHGIYFPGGKAIGVGLMINLIAAHSARFKANGTPSGIISGSISVLIGLLFTALIVAGASYSDGVQDEPMVSYAFIWRTMLSTTIAFAAALTGMIFLIDRRKSLEIILLIIGVLLSITAAIGLFVLGSMYEQMESAMRIVWQLAQATIVGCVLLLGCSLIFKNRGGIVLLHFGIGLMMVNELFVGMYAVEEKITAAMGETTEYAYNTQEVELSITVRDKDNDRVVSIPFQQLRDGKKIKHELLPFSIDTVAYFPNSKITSKSERGEVDFVTVKNKEVQIKPTSGRGLYTKAIEVPRVTGADKNQQVDTASVYISVKQENNDKTNVLLLSQYFSDLIGTKGWDDGANTEKLLIDGTVYEFNLRFRRTLKPYQLTLISAKKDSYAGSDSPSEYGSTFTILDKSSKEQQTAVISMNNPLRYKGETFYQAGYNERPSGNGKRIPISTLQVVTNQGWMIPYVGCMYVVIGMIAQFGGGLLKFSERVQKRSRKKAAESSQPELKNLNPAKSLSSLTAESSTSYSAAAWIIPLVLFLLAAYASYKLTFSGNAKSGEFNIKEAGKIAVASSGRFKPIDSYARVFLRNFSDYESVSLTDKQVKAQLKGDRKRIYSVEWLLDVITNPEMADEEYRVFRIYDPYLKSRLGLEKQRKGHTYTYNEVTREFKEFSEYARLAMREQNENGGKLDKLSFAKRKSISLFNQIRQYENFQNASFIPKETPAETLNDLINGKIKYWRQKAVPAVDDSSVTEFMKSLVNRLAAEDEPEDINYFTYIRGFISEGRGSLVVGQKDNPLFSPTFVKPDLVVEDLGMRLNLPLGDAENSIQKGSIVFQSDDSTMWKLVNDTRGSATEPSIELDWEKQPGMEVLTVASARQALREFCVEKKISDSRSLVEELMKMDPISGPYFKDSQAFRRGLSERVTKALKEYNANVVKLFESLPPDLRARLEQNPENLSAFLLTELDKQYSSRKFAELQFIEESYLALISELLGDDFDSKTQSTNRLTELFSLYDGDKAEEFNSLAEQYIKEFEAIPLAEFDARKHHLEHFYHYSAPLFQALIFYGISALFVMLAWTMYGVSLDSFGEGMQRSALIILAVGSLLHTIGIVERVMITGKAPVTNLYASAVFISWGSVVCGLIIDFIIRYAAPKAAKIGFGTLLGSVMGFIVIVVSYNLALRSDTFGKLQAVLDTQFWLATHVVCVTFGYVATFVAGALGLIFLGGSAFTKVFDKEIRQSVSWIIYGIVCFALLLSFFGTVLGGLWADDSWGRFWGWDPKENGALLIVIWNALILHARWGGMIRERGMAVLATLGNVVTCWSWFGVNELGVGLHSYGFTDGVLKSLFWVALAHTTVAIIAASVPTRFWRGYSAETNSTSQDSELTGLKSGHSSKKNRSK